MNRLTEEYWIHKFQQGFDEVTFPFQKKNEKVLPESDLGRKEISCKIKNSQSFVGISKGSDMALFMILVSQCQMLLSRYTGIEKTFIGTLTPLTDNKPQNLVYIGSMVNGKSVLKEILTDIKSDVLSSFSNGNIPFKDLEEKLKINIEGLSIPKSIAIIYDNLQGNSDGLEDFHLVVNLKEVSGDYFITATFNSKIYNENIISDFIQNLSFCLSHIKSNVNVSVDNLNILHSSQKIKLDKFGLGKKEEVQGKTIAELFSEQSHNSRDVIAATYQDKTTTYGELHEKSNELAFRIIEKGIKPNDVVAICMDRSFEMLCSILAVLKAGGAFLPVDISLPESRIRNILADSTPTLLLGDKELNIDETDRFSIFKFDYNELNRKKDNITISNSLDGVAYFLYTSGSTGKPKAVKISQSSLLNLCRWYKRTHKVDNTSNVLLVIPLSFDASIKNIITPLLCGGKVCLANRGVYDPKSIFQIMENRKVTHINCVPSTIYPIIDLVERDNAFPKIDSLKYLALGGESMNINLIQPLVNNTSAIVSNIYGPTECTDISSFYILSKKDHEKKQNVSIGVPIDNAVIQICNDNLQIQPIGVKGEIIIGGLGVGIEYHDNPTLSSEKFIEINQKKYYKTGDLGRWLPNGNIEFLGRKDYQVKIRGQRIELGEIESILAEVKGIKEGVVELRKDQNNTEHLCAYYTSDSEISSDDIRKALSEHLSSNFLPTFYTKISAFSLTNNGKLNRSILPNPDFNSRFSDSLFVEPRTALERKISEIWKEVLSIENASINDNFFDVGGNSLSLVVMSDKLKSDLGKDITPVQLFNYTTIRSLAEFINKGQTRITSNTRDESISAGKNLMVNKFLKKTS